MKKKNEIRQKTGKTLRKVLLLLLLSLTMQGMWMTMSNEKVSAEDFTNYFNFGGPPDRSDGVGVDPPSASGKSIIFQRDNTKPLPRGAGGVATSKFTLDFSRNFVINGFFTPPKEDGIGFALHTNPNKAAVTPDYSTGMVIKPLNDVPAGTAYKTDATYDVQDMPYGLLWNVMSVELGPYEGKAMQNGVYGYQMVLEDHSPLVPLYGEESYKAHIITGETEYPFELSYTCTTSETGKLTVKLPNFERVYDINAKTVFGGGDKYKNVYFSMSGWVTEHTNSTAKLTFAETYYTDWRAGSIQNNTTFWADRDGDGVFEKKVSWSATPNATNAAYAGETIQVKHEITGPENSVTINVPSRIKNLYDDKDVKYYGTNRKINGEPVIDVDGDPDKDKDEDLNNDDNAYNQVLLAPNADPTKPENKGKVERYTYIIIPFKPGQSNVFTYEMTAPAYATIVREAACFGQDPFDAVETSLASYSTFVPVCKIGNVGYETLQAAIDDVPATNVETTIEMLVDYDLSKAHTIPVGKNIVLTTADKGTGPLNFKGTVTTSTLKRATTYTAGHLFEVNGSLKLENVTIDGGAVWGAAGSDLEERMLGRTRTNTGIAVKTRDSQMFNVISGATLTVGSGAVVQNQDMKVYYTSADGSMNSNACDKGIFAYVLGTLNITDDAVIKNIAGQRGSDGSGTYGYAVDGIISTLDGNSNTKIVMSGGTISGCETSRLGTVLRLALNAGTFEMSGGTINNNMNTAKDDSAALQYGIIYCQSGSAVALTGGKILNNWVQNKDAAGAVYVDTDNFQISGEPIVNLNRHLYMKDSKNVIVNQNIYLPSGKNLKVTGNLGTNAKIGVTADTLRNIVGKQFGVSTNAASTYTGLDHFYNDIDTGLTGMAGTGNAVVWGSKYVCKIGNVGYETLQAAIDAINNGTATDINGAKGTDKTDYKIEMLVENYDLSQAHTIPAGKNIVLTTAAKGSDTDTGSLDFKGTGTTSTLKRASTYTAGRLFEVNGSLKLENVTIDGGAVWGPAPMQTDDMFRNAMGRSSTNNGIAVTTRDSQMFNIAGGAALTVGSKAVVQNQEMKAYYTTPNNVSAADRGVFAMVAGTLTIQDDAIIKNIVNAKDEAGKYGYAADAIISTNGGNSNSKIVMTGGLITGCEASRLGAVIRLHVGSFEMSGGDIGKNMNLANDTSDTSGYGIIHCGTGTNVTLTGGTISSNTLRNDKAGAFLVMTDNFKIQGKPNISNNRYVIDKDTTKARNIYLLPNKNLQVTGDLVEGANIGVTADTTRNAMGDQFGISTPNDAPTYKGLEYFHNDVNASLFGADGRDNKVVWSIDAYTLNFDTKGGSTISPISVPIPKDTVILEDAGFQAVADPTKAGYVFAGWYTDEDTTIPLTSVITMDGDKTIYAKWEYALATSTKTVDKVAARVGDTVTWTITITNKSAAPLSNIAVTDTLDANLQFADISCDTGITLTAAGDNKTDEGKLSYTVSTVPANGQVEVKIKTKIKDTATVNSTIGNSATITDPGTGLSETITSDREVTVQETPELSKSKTAEAVENTVNQYKVTLDLAGAATTKKKMEIVFCMDYENLDNGTTPIQQVRQYIAGIKAILSDLVQKDNIDIKVGLVGGSQSATDTIESFTKDKENPTSGLVTLNSSTLPMLEGALEYKPSETIGTDNGQEMVLMANDMLDNGSDAEKHIILYNDFLNYYYQGKVTGEDGKVYTTNGAYNEFGGGGQSRALDMYYFMSGGERHNGSLQEIGFMDDFTADTRTNEKYKTFAELLQAYRDGFPGTVGWGIDALSDFALASGGLENHITESRMDDYKKAKSNKTNAWDSIWTAFDNTVPENANKHTVTGFEKSMVLTYDALEDSIKKGYHLSIISPTNARISNYKYQGLLINGMLDTLSGEDNVNVQNMLINSETTMTTALTGLKNDLFYQFASGEVTDVIGKNFNLVAADAAVALADNKTFTLQVGETLYSPSRIEANTYYFDTIPEGEGETVVYEYEVTYNPNDPNEKFTWKINTPVTMENPIRLSYVVEANSADEDASGALKIAKDLRGGDADPTKEFTFKITLQDADGNAFKLSEVPTNESAELTYRGSEEGAEDRTEAFEKPTVALSYSYTGTNQKADGTLTFEKTEDGSVKPFELKLKGGQSATITGLPTSIWVYADDGSLTEKPVYYKVEEDEANADSYTTTIEAKGTTTAADAAIDKAANNSSVTGPVASATETQTTNDVTFHNVKGTVLNLSAKAVNKLYAHAGDDVDWQIQVRNNGLAQIDNIKVIDALNANLAYQKGTCVVNGAAMGTVSHNSGTVQVTGISLQPGEIAFITITARVNKDTAKNTLIPNTADIYVGENKELSVSSDTLTVIDDTANSEIAVDKTATDDSDSDSDGVIDRWKVQLALPDTDTDNTKKRDVDIVFVCDGSSQEKGIYRDKTAVLFDELLDNRYQNINFHIGVVSFNSVAFDMIGLVRDTGETYNREEVYNKNLVGLQDLETSRTDIENAITYDLTTERGGYYNFGGSNTEVGVLLANLMLKQSTSGASADNKHILFLSDMQGYMYNGELEYKNSEGETVTLGSEARDENSLAGIPLGKSLGFNFASIWNGSAFGTNFDDLFKAYEDGSLQQMQGWDVDVLYRATNSATDYSLDPWPLRIFAPDMTLQQYLWYTGFREDGYTEEALQTAPGNTVENKDQWKAIKDSTKKTATGLDKSLIKTYEALEASISAGYQVSIIEVQNVNSTTAPCCIMVKNFVSWLGQNTPIPVYTIPYAEGGNEDYKEAVDGFRDEVVTALGKGTVTDYIGEHFDLVQNTDSKKTFTLHVGDNTYTADKVDGNTYYFGTITEGEGEKVYEYVVTYVPDSDTEKEHLTWEINVPATYANQLKLDYLVKTEAPGKTGDLTISKEITGTDTSADDDFTFRVTFKDGGTALNFNWYTNERAFVDYMNSDNAEADKYTYNHHAEFPMPIVHVTQVFTTTKKNNSGDTETGTLTFDGEKNEDGTYKKDGMGSFSEQDNAQNYMDITLKGGESLTIKGIPAGWTYEVQELKSVTGGDPEKTTLTPINSTTADEEDPDKDNSTGDNGYRLTSVKDFNLADGKRNVGDNGTEATAAKAAGTIPDGAAAVKPGREAAFTNTKDLPGMAFSFGKVAAEKADTTSAVVTSEEKLTGAEFKLFKLTCDNDAEAHVSANHASVPNTVITDATPETPTPEGSCWTLYATGSTDDAGSVSLERVGETGDKAKLLETGDYYLVETKSPLGYKLPTGQWKITIDTTQPNIQDRITIAADPVDQAPAFLRLYTVEVTNGEEGETAVVTPAEYETPTNGREYGAIQTVSYKLPNVKNFALPFAGELGVFFYLLLGMLAMAGSVCGFLLYRRISLYGGYKGIKNTFQAIMACRE